MAYDPANVKLYALEPGYPLTDPWLLPWAPPPLIEVFDSVGLSDAVLVDKNIATSDSIALSDAVFRDWMPRILDAISLSDQPLVHKQALVTDIIQIIEEIPSTPEKIKFVTDFISLIESFLDVWKGCWDEPIQTLYQALRELKLKLVTEKDIELKVKEA